jgi:hypothetical protein
MPRKQPAEPVFRIYMPAMGGVPIGAQEMSRKDGIIVVRDPVLISPREDGVGYNFTPVQFVLPGEPFELHASGLLANFKMPAALVPWFQKYQANRKKGSENDPS